MSAYFSKCIRGSSARDCSRSGFFTGKLMKAADSPKIYEDGSRSKYDKEMNVTKDWPIHGELAG
jgi:hypothetical protein